MKTVQPHFWPKLYFDPAVSKIWQPIHQSSTVSLVIVGGEGVFSLILSLCDCVWVWVSARTRISGHFLYACSLSSSVCGIFLFPCFSVSLSLCVTASANPPISLSLYFLCFCPCIYEFLYIFLSVSLLPLSLCLSLGLHFLNFLSLSSFLCFFLNLILMKIMSLKAEKCHKVLTVWARRLCKKPNWINGIAWEKCMFNKKQMILVWSY